MISFDLARRRTVVYDGITFFLLRNLLINQPSDNLMIICHASTGGADVRDWSVFLSPPSSSFKRHVPGWARSSWGTEGRLTSVDIFPRTSPARRAGIVSPVTLNTDTRRPCGPHTPVRDDVWSLGITGRFVYPPP